MGSVQALPNRSVPSIHGAVGEFLATLTPATSRTYQATLRRLLTELDRRTVAELDTPAGAAALRGRFAELWDSTAASTWNRHVCAVRSTVAYWRGRGWLVGDPAAGLVLRRPARPRQRARGRGDIAELLRREDLPLRDRALWSLLYDTAARSAEVLALDVEDLDLRNRRASVRRKGGAPDVIAWHTRTARLLGRLVADRRSGPVFLTDRQAKGARRGYVQRRDLDPVTSRGRLSYRRAAELFTTASGGWTLHDLRHSALTHGAEDGMNAPMLMVKSGHQDIRTLARYARPSIDAVQRWEEHHSHPHAGAAGRAGHAVTAVTAS